MFFPPLCLNFWNHGFAFWFWLCMLLLWWEPLRMLCLQYLSYISVLSIVWDRILWVVNTEEMLLFWRFIIGFFLAAIPWYVGALILLCSRIDYREKPGFIACTIAVSNISLSLSLSLLKICSTYYSTNIFSYQQLRGFPPSQTIPFLSLTTCSFF